MIYFALGVLIGITISIVIISLMFKDEVQFIPSDQLPPGWDFHKAKDGERLVLIGRN